MSKNSKLDITKISKIEDLQKLNLSFEEAYKHLESIILLQENEDTSLEESVSLYKVGKILLEYCQSILDKFQLELEDMN